MTSATPKPRAGEHTKGPWKIGYSDGSGMGEDGEGAYILDADENPVVWGGRDDWGCAKGARDMATARRIVACVNACEGIPTASLELGDTKQWIKEEIALRGERDLLRGREKVLVAAIETALAYCESEAIGTVQQEIADNERMRQTLRNALEYGR